MPYNELRIHNNKVQFLWVEYCKITIQQLHTAIPQFLRSTISLIPHTETSWVQKIRRYGGDNAQLVVISAIRGRGHI